MLLVIPSNSGSTDWQLIARFSKKQQCSGFKASRGEHRSTLVMVAEDTDVKLSIKQENSEARVTGI